MRQWTVIPAKFILKRDKLNTQIAESLNQNVVVLRVASYGTIYTRNPLRRTSQTIFKNSDMLVGITRGQYISPKNNS